MRRLLIPLALAAAVATVRAQERHVIDTEAAIAQGAAGQTLEKRCSARGENGFDLVVEGPTGRVMRAARESKKAGRPFGVSDVTGAMSGPFVTVLARRDQSLSTRSSAVPQAGAPGAWVLPPSAEAERAHERMTMGSRYRADIVIKSKKSGGTPAIQLEPVGPILYTDPVWTSGTRTIRAVEDTNMAASFDLYAFQRLPPGDVQVVAFMTDAGERTCTIGEKDRQKIR